MHQPAPPVRMATLRDLLAVSQGEGLARDIGLTLNRIYFLDIAAVRRILGQRRWLAKRAVVHGVVRSCIQRYLRAEDVSVELSEDQYTLIFHDDDVEQIAARCRRLAAATEIALFGQKGLSRVLVRDAATVFAEGAVVRTADPAADGLDPDSPLLAEAADAEPEPTPLPATPPAMLSSDEREARRHALLELLAQDQEESVGYGFLPMWHAREGRIATYICRPRRGDGVEAEIGYGVLGHAPDNTAIAQLDTHAVEECLFALKRLADTQARINLLTTVHFETLASRSSRSQLQEFLAAVPNLFRRRLTLHVAEMPTGIPEARLNEITTAIAGWVRNLVVEVRMSECPTLRALGARAWLYARARIGIVAFDFEGMASEEMLQRARRVAGVLVPRGLQLSALNVPSRDALCELATSDFAFLGGPPIGGFQPRPGPPRPFTMRDLERATGAALPATGSDAVYI